jgi:hypothetical protein
MEREMYPEINSTDFELKLLASYSKFDTFFITYKYDSISKKILPYRTMENQCTHTNKALFNDIEKLID